MVGKLVGEAGSAVGVFGRVSLHVAQQHQVSARVDPSRGKVLPEVLPRGVGGRPVVVADLWTRDGEGAQFPGHGDCQLAVDAVRLHARGRAADLELCGARVQRENEGELLCPFVPPKCSC